MRRPLRFIFGLRVDDECAVLPREPRLRDPGVCAGMVRHGRHRTSTCKTSATDRKYFPIATRIDASQYLVGVGHRTRWLRGNTSGGGALAAENRCYLLRRFGFVTRRCLSLTARFAPDARKCLAQIGIGAGCVTERRIEDGFHCAPPCARGTAAVAPKHRGMRAVHQTDDVVRLQELCHAIRVGAATNERRKPCPTIELRIVKRTDTALRDDASANRPPRSCAPEAQ